ncbi:MAG TPA: galactokinase [Desulfobacterales bacterium]|nr:galactokinase [Desulfobacterales bacterium]
MIFNLKKNLEKKPVEVSVPCRIDMGGSLDIDTFSYPLRYLYPCTFNIALDLRTLVGLFPYKEGRIKVTSRGFKSSDYSPDRAPFNHPLGLMFAIAAYFRAEGVHIIIDSSSPPRSALGGSSAAAVALVTAFLVVSEKVRIAPKLKKKVALLSHALEESVAGVPCGRQDQLAAAFGGVNAWYWQTGNEGAPYIKETIVKKADFKRLEKHLLLAYCGVPHESKNVNGIWVSQFLAGRYRRFWGEIAVNTKKFVDALAERNYKKAVVAMNREMVIRRNMTPEVLDDMGEKLVNSAVKNNCGARFTGAGGGGCIWALGEINDIDRLRVIWKELLATQKGASLLDVKIDSKGLKIEGRRYKGRREKK